MAKYFRTVEMSRFIRFRCHACAATMAERLRHPTVLELRCTNTDACGLVLLVVTTEAIPVEPTTTSAASARQELVLQHGEGWRCYNCGKRLQAVGKGAWHGPAPDQHCCPRCNTWHLFGSRVHPPALPARLRAAAEPAPAGAVAAPATS